MPARAKPSRDWWRWRIFPDEERPRPGFTNSFRVQYEENGEPLEDGTMRLVVPGDMRGGRYVSGVTNISLRDAPAGVSE